MEQSSKSVKIKFFIILHASILMLSFGEVCAKMAGKKEMLSLEFFFFYGLFILLLGIYAIVWQQIIKRLPLNTAYCDKAVNVIWGMLLGTIIFGEQIRWNMILGAAVVIIGVVLVVKSDE